MKLFKRFAYYLGGFSMGVIFLLFFWGGKETSCSYFPNSRVLKEIRSKEQKFSPEALSFFKENNIDSAAIDGVLQHGKVHFDKSEKGRNLECRRELYNENYKIASILEAHFKENIEE